MKAADIPDEVMLAAVTHLCSGWWSTAHRNDVEREVSERLGVEVPWKVTLAKARSMIRRGLLDGCACGCSGAWTVKT